MHSLTLFFNLLKRTRGTRHILCTWVAPAGLPVLTAVGTPSVSRARRVLALCEFGAIESLFVWLIFVERNESRVAGATKFRVSKE